MDYSASVLRCANCGSTFPADDGGPGPRPGAATQRCPVCHMPVTREAPRHLASAEDFGVHLGHLVARARASGVPPAEIIQVLRDELVFMAEFAHRGRQLCVQIIDLGPSEADVAQPFDLDGREVLSSRGHLPVSVS
jgi:hypothetical protein